MLCPEELTSKSTADTVQADLSGSQAVYLSAIWSEIRAGRLIITSSLCSADRCYLTLRESDPARAEMVQVREHLGQPRLRHLFTKQQHP